MLVALSIKNFKSIREAHVRFGPFTCFIGHNGVGKSNLFDAIHFLSLLADRNISDAATEVRRTSDGGCSLMLVDVQDRAVLCIEEPENGIHPSRVPNLAELLRDYAVDAHHAVGTDNPLRQVVLNSHSPEVARQFSCDDLIFVERALTSTDGPISVFRPIADTWRTTLSNGAQSTVLPIDGAGGRRLHRGFARQPRVQATEPGVWIGHVNRQLAYAVVADGGTDRLLVPIIQPRRPASMPTKARRPHRADPDPVYAYEMTSSPGIERPTKSRSCVRSGICRWMAVAAIQQSPASNRRPIRLLSCMTRAHVRANSWSDGIIKKRRRKVSSSVLAR